MNKIANELMKLAKEMTAASEIEFKDLPIDRQAMAKDLGLNPVVAWEGIHGYVIMLEGAMTARLDVGDLRKLVSNRNFRWIEASGRGRISIGC